MVDRYTIVTDPETLRDIEQDERDTTIREDRDTFICESCGEPTPTDALVDIGRGTYCQQCGDAIEDEEDRPEPTDEQINEMLERCFEIEETARKKGIR